MMNKLFIPFCLIIFLFSCSDDESQGTGPNVSVPILQIVASDSTISSDDTLDAGSLFDIAFTGRKGPVDLVSWTLSLDNVDLDTYSNVPVNNSTSFTEVISDLEAPLTSGNYIYTISLKDANNISVEKSLSIAVIEDAVLEETSFEILESDSTVFGDTTLAIGTIFNINIKAIGGFYPMVTWSVLLDGLPLSSYNELPVPNDSSFNAWITDISIPSLEGTYNYSFQVTNSNGDKSSISWQIVAADIPTFTEYTNIQLGAQASPNFGAFFLVRQVEVSTLSEANASNGEAVEFFYYNGATNGPTFFSPNDPDAGSLYGGSVASWFIRFDTQLQKTTLDYNTVTAQDIDESLISGTKVNQLVIGDVVLVETPLGDKAILIIRTLNSGNAGNIEFDIKIID